MNFSTYLPCSALSIIYKMSDYKTEFLKTALQAKALKFGDFTLKSGRKSPYFFNMGQFTTGAALSSLAVAYAQSIIDAKLEFDILFGPAYKGISLAALTAAKLAEIDSEKWGKIEYAYNRKEKKDHGEGGIIVGANLDGQRVVIIDDVMSAGTATNEAYQMVSSQGGKVAAIVLALDRMETTLTSDKSAVQTAKEKYGIPVVTIATLNDITEKLDHILTDENREAIAEYRKKYVPST